MPSDITKIAFSTEYPIDRISYENEDGSFQYTQSAGTSSTNTIPNPVGRKAFVTMAWSINGADYYPAQAYTVTTNNFTANAWCDDTLIYIYTENNSASSKTFTILLTLDEID